MLVGGRKNFCLENFEKRNQPDEKQAKLCQIVCVRRKGQSEILMGMYGLKCVRLRLYLAANSVYSEGQFWTEL